MTTGNSIAPGNFHLSPEGKGFIKNEEGFRQKAYPDAGRYSIGFGHQLRPNEMHLRGSGISRQHGEQLFERDIGWVEDAINQNVRVPLNQKQVDMLGSLAYNVGPKGFAGSEVIRHLNGNDYDGASQAFGRHITSRGRVNPILVDRRKREVAVFNGADYGSGAQGNIMYASYGGSNNYSYGQSSGGGFFQGVGNYLGGMGNVFKGWFTDEETGQFSMKKTMLSLGGLLALVWAASNMSILFAVTMAFVALATYMVVGGGGMKHWGEPRYDGPPLAPGMGRSPYREASMPQMENQMQQMPETPRLNLPEGMFLNISDVQGAPAQSNVPLQNPLSGASKNTGITL